MQIQLLLPAELLRELGRKCHKMQAKTGLETLNSIALPLMKRPGEPDSPGEVVVSVALALGI